MFLNQSSVCARPICFVLSVRHSCWKPYGHMVASHAIVYQHSGHGKDRQGKTGHLLTEMFDVLIQWILMIVLHRLSIKTPKLLSSKKTKSVKRPYKWNGRHFRESILVNQR